jgi:hypothetical protein
MTNPQNKTPIAYLIAYLPSRSTSAYPIYNILLRLHTYSLLLNLPNKLPSLHFKNNFLA